ncbi:MAG: 50S ribosomal protein L23 [Candidatus Peribacteraceae bacterium]
MHLSTVIIGPVVTEKAEAMKTQKTYVIQVRSESTKVDVKNALKQFYDVDVSSIRALRTRPKVRNLGQGKTLEKRHRTKRMIVTLSKKSKALDLSTLRAS